MARENKSAPPFRAAFEVVAADAGELFVDACVAAPCRPTNAAAKKSGEQNEKSVRPLILFLVPDFVATALR